MNHHAINAYITCFETLSPQSLDSLEHVFAENARFKDPFNDVIGIEAIKQIFRHMYATTQDSHFIVSDHAASNHILYLYWDYHFNTLRGQSWSITGMSRVVFENEKAIEHVDYWDPAEGIYEKLPILGGLMRLLKRKLSAV